MFVSALFVLYQAVWFGLICRYMTIYTKTGLLHPKSKKKSFDGRNSFSKTDIDATFLHMKEDRMRNN